LDSIAEEAANILGADGAILWKWDQENKNFQYLSGCGTGQQLDDNYTLYTKAPTSSLGQAASRKKALQITANDPANSSIESDWLVKTGFNSILLLPLIYQDDVLGIIEIHDLNKYFDMDDILIAQLFASHAVLAIENASLYGMSSREVESRKLIEEKLRFDEFHDALTQLTDRTVFYRHLERAVVRKRRFRDFTFAVLFMDLDRFRTVNSQYGYQVGDLALQEIASRLKQTTRELDTISRFGSDKFLILLEGGVDQSNVKHFVSRLQTVLSSPVQIRNQPLDFKASFGVALSSNEKVMADEYIRNAGMALRQAKAQGGGTFCIFSDKTH
jgi:diguanylate cyclase (GGDEF)-like protein